MNNTVPIVLSTDDKFAKYCSIAIASLIKHASLERRYDIYIFYDEISEEYLHKLLSMGTENVRIQGVSISEWVDKKILYVYDWISIATYYRFFAADVLKQYEKILYIDSDVVILDDIANLYDEDLKNNLLGGVVIFRDSPYEREIKNKYLGSIGLQPTRYINAGVLSINAKLFREERIYKKCIRCLQENRTLQWMDQDVLNIVCKDRIKYIDQEWNMQQAFFDEDVRNNKSISKVKLLHYTTGEKPGKHSYRISHLYAYQYALLSPFQEELNEDFLKCNINNYSDAKKEIYDMSGRCDVGPRFFYSCLKQWVKGKSKRKAKNK